MKLAKFAVTLALVLAVVGGYGVFTAQAGRRTSSAVLGNKAPHTTTASGLEALKKSVLVGGFSGASLPVGQFILIDGTTLKCPGTSGSCTYRADNNLQIAAAATSNWALLTEVDGIFIGDGGPYLGPVGTDFAAGNWSDFGTGYGVGNHTIQSFAFMRDQAGTAFNYDFNYAVYKP